MQATRTRTRASHPEMSGGVAWLPIPFEEDPQTPPQTPPTAPTPPVKAIVAGVGVMALLSAGVAWRVYEAGVAHGSSTSQARITQLESEATVTNTGIKNFCEAYQ